MKKILFILSLAFASMAASAQLYVGGSVGFNSNGTKPEGNAAGNTSWSRVIVSPEIGYALDEKMDLGLEFTFGLTTDKRDLLVDKKTATDWEIAPYFRYSILEFGKFSVLGKASVYVRGLNSKTIPLTGSNIESSSTTFGIGILPMLTYDISDKFVLFTNLNFLRVSFSSTSVKDFSKSSVFNLGANANDLLNVGNIAVGFAYKL